MKREMKGKYAGSCKLIAALQIFLMAGFLPGLSYADNISPEMNRLTPVINLSQNQDSKGSELKPASPEQDVIEKQNPFKQSENSEYQEAQMRLLKPVDELLPPMEPEYGKMLFWADKIEQVAAEAGNKLTPAMEAEVKPANLELLARLDDAREAMEAGPEPKMSSEWIRAEEEDFAEPEKGSEKVIESRDYADFEPTQVPLTLGGGDFTVDYAASEQEDLMVKALQELADTEHGVGKSEKEKAGKENPASA